MSQAIWSDKKIFAVSVAAAACTTIAGIYHLIMVERSMSREPLQGILFLVGGILQVFWALPVMKRWGRIWQIIGIVGTAVFFLLWFLNRLHLLPEAEHQGIPQGQDTPRFPTQQNMTLNPEGGRPSGQRQGGMPFISGNAVPIEIAQILFIGLYITLAKMIANRKH